eukprot:gene9889-gene7885
MLAGLAVLGDTGLEATLGGVDHEHSGVGLGRAGDHVLDEVTVPGASMIVKTDLGTELPEGNIDGNATLTLSLELIQHPGVLE